MQLLLSKNAINKKYGRRIGFIKLIGARVIQFFCGYRSFNNIAWEKVQRLVFICHGNICRSAYAHEHARMLGLNVASAGLGARKNGGADQHAIAIAATRGINLLPHKTTPVKDLVLESGDLFLCMEPVQATQVRSLIDENEHQITLLGLWSDSKRPFLQDPYGLEDPYWHTCFDVIDSALSEIKNRVSSSC